MGRKSTKTNKNIYQQLREGLGWTREEAESRLDSISADRIAKIEGNKSQPYPFEVLTMSEVYGQPALCNYYCTKECEIGAKYVPVFR